MFGAVMANVDKVYFYFFGLAQFFLLTTLVCRYCNVWKLLTFTVFLWRVAPLNVLMNKNKTCFGIIPTFPNSLMVVATLVNVCLFHFTASLAYLAAGYIPCCTHSFNFNFCYVHTKTIYLR